MGSPSLEEGSLWSSEAANDLIQLAEGWTRDHWRSLLAAVVLCKKEAGGQNFLRGQGQQGGKNAYALSCFKRGLEAELSQFCCPSVMIHPSLWCQLQHRKI